MISENYVNYEEKLGRITRGVKKVSAGINTETNKPYDAYAYFFVLEVNARDSTKFPIDMSKVDEFEEITRDMSYLDGVKVTCVRSDTGKLTAISVEPLNFSKVWFHGGFMPPKERGYLWN